MDDLIFWPPSWSMALLLPALFVGFTVHELGHAVVAYLLGDTSQVEQRRLSWNPLRHVSWVGLVVFLIFGFGWAKPVRVNPSRFRMSNGALGFFLVSISGASANLLTALVVFAGMMVTASIVWTTGGASPLATLQFLTLQGTGLDAQGVAVALSGNLLTVNLLLAVFNLLPLPPLDGFQAAVSLVAAIRTALGRGGASKPDAAPRQAVAGREMGDEPDGAEGAADGRPSQIHFDIGLEYHRAGQLDEAIARYRQATSHDEHFGLAYYNLGVAYWEKGRIPLAISAFRAARDCPGLTVQVEANRCLRDLAVAEQNPDVEPGPAPPPREPQEPGVQEEEAPRPLDPAVVRRVWLSLAAGGAGALLLAVAAWFYVTAVTLSALGGAALP
jgi:Zn-dependent protease